MSPIHLPQAHLQRATSVFRAFQLWFLGYPRILESLQKSTSSKIRPEIKLIIEDCQVLREEDYHIGRVVLARNRTLRDITMGLINSLDDGDILILSLLAWYFRSPKDIPSRYLLKFAAQPFPMIYDIIPELYRRYIKESRLISRKVFRKSVLRVLGFVQDCGIKRLYTY
ncbi:hypothetical protein N7466_011054 [Penicillium verhagenii]|uniref:uncharacterized protein n=1 Tax=Penicillium verhagenii TaxID=1562060 RepID=UPI002545536E|nr:uncharacterized protein N7466_011054 [Penicillium verhagenii]KAJ5917500.1 hypothetical protein N7466_011054 [Penicillium verhagenii]